MATIPTLEELCFRHIARTLEEYAVEKLALLPKRYRKKLLVCLPLLDVCQLEETQFTEDIDMELIWEEICNSVFPFPLNCSSTDSWRRELLDSLFEMLLESILEGHDAVDNHVVTSEAKRLVAMNVTGLKEERLIPPRYASLSQRSKSLFSATATAIELISEKCCFSPNAMSINVPVLITFLKKAKRNLNFLAKPLKEVKCLNLDFENNKVEQIELLEGVYSKLLALSSTDSNNISELVLAVSIKYTFMIDEIIPVLPLFTRLTRLSINKEYADYGEISLETHKFISLLVAFLSSPCTHEQTLVMEDANIGIKSKGRIKTAASSRSMAKLMVGLDHTYMKYKSLEFFNEVDNSCIRALHNLAPLTLKRLALYGSNSSMLFFALALQPEFDLETLYMRNAVMTGQLFAQYNSFLQKRSLKSVTFDCCGDLDSDALRRAAEIHKFAVEENNYSKPGREKEVIDSDMEMSDDISGESLGYEESEEEIDNVDSNSESSLEDVAPSYCLTKL